MSDATPFNISNHSGFESCCHISDEDVNARARADISKLPAGLRAMRDRCIVWVAPFRKDGVIEIPWDFQGNSVEAVMVSDGSSSDIPQGTRIMVRPDEGVMHEVNGVPLCFIKRESLMLVETV